MIESKYRNRTNEFLERNGRDVLTLSDRVTKGVPDTAVSWSGTVWVEHKVIRRGTSWDLTAPIPLRAHLRRDLQLHRMVKLEDRGAAYYLMHLERGYGRGTKYVTTLITLPSVVQNCVVKNLELEVVTSWEGTIDQRLAEPSLPPIGLSIGSIYAPDDMKKLLEVM